MSEKCNVEREKQLLSLIPGERRRHKTTTAKSSKYATYAKSRAANFARTRFLFGERETGEMREKVAVVKSNEKAANEK